jgi:hypothetical protein
MNYTNREVAQALKDAGFNEKCIYMRRVDGSLDKFHKEFSNSDYSKLSGNALMGFVSAPDFLTAADWIEKESGGKIKVEFYPNTAFLSEPSTGVTFIESSDYPDRYAFRNKAILCALSDLKKLKETNS